jgi:hypothetical protein
MMLMQLREPTIRENCAVIRITGPWFGRATIVVRAQPASRETNGGHDWLGWQPISAPSSQVDLRKANVNALRTL